MRRHRWFVVLLGVGLVAASCGRSETKGAASITLPSDGGAATDTCASEPLRATEVGVTDSTITVEVMADFGSPLAPGLFQGNVDGMEAFAEHVNASGGIGCRKLVVKTWDSHLSADESKNGLIDSCSKAVAMVGTNALFNPDVAAMTDCVDQVGARTGLPDLAALAVDVAEMCSPVTFVIQSVYETCPITPGVRKFTQMVGPTQWYVDTLMKGTKLHGLYLVPGDLPTTIQSATSIVASMQQAGVTFDDILRVSGRATQSDFTPMVQVMKAHHGNFVYDGSNDTVMVAMRKEALAQGLDGVKLWGCSLSCYTEGFITNGGAAVEGTYAWMQFLPFEEAAANEELTAYLAGVGDKADSFGAQAWQAGVLFQQIVDGIVAKDGPNAITRAKILEALKSTKDFTANGWIGKKDLRGTSPCFAMLQVQDAKWVRVYPKKAGTFDCDADNIVQVSLDPALEAGKIR